MVEYSRHNTLTYIVLYTYFISGRLHVPHTYSGPVVRAQENQRTGSTGDMVVAYNIPSFQTIHIYCITYIPHTMSPILLVLLITIMQRNIGAFILR